MSINEIAKALYGGKKAVFKNGALTYIAYPNNIFGFEVEELNQANNHARPTHARSVAELEEAMEQVATLREWTVQ